MRRIGSGLFRLFLSILVVLHHSLPLRLGPWAVYVFFILSGFWISRMWRRRYAHTHHAFLTFVVSRWWRLAPVFLACTALSVVSRFLLNGAIAWQRPSSISWWLRQLLIVGSNDAGTDLPPAWSLDVEMQFYLVAPVLIALFARIKPAFRYLTVATAGTWLVFFLLRRGNVQLAHLPLFLGFFLVGISIEISQWKPSHGDALASLLIFFGITLGLALFPPTQRGVWRAGLDPWQELPTVCTASVNLWWAAGAVSVAPFLAWNVAQASPPWDRFLGNLAYPLYLFHWIPLEWYNHLRMRSDTIWGQYALLATSYLVEALGAVVILLLIDQPLDSRRANWVAARKSTSDFAPERGAKAQVL